MKRSLRSLTGIVALLVAGSASAKDLPNYNAYDADKPVTPALTPSARELASGFAAAMDAQRGVPSFVWSAAPAAMFQPPQIALATHETAARAHLLKVAPMYGVSAVAIDTAVVNYVHDLGRGGIIVSFRQVVDGVELYRNDIKVLMRRSHELVAISGSPNPAAVAGMSKLGSIKWTLSAENALARSLNDLYALKLAATSILDLKTTRDNYRYFDLLSTPEVKANNLHMSEPARVKPVYFPLPDRLVPAYFVEVLVGPASSTDADAYRYVIAADDGRLLYRENLKHSAAFNYRVWADPYNPGDGRPLDGPIADFTPHPTGMPDGSFPAYIMPSLITIDGFNKNPNNTFDPWLAAGATVTQGNNVDAYTDIVAPDGYTNGQDFRADVTSPGTFDRVYDVAQDPVPNGIANQAQGKAALAQIFYTTNWLHDWWYDSGFNEAAGNAQQNNFGRGGVGNDRLHAEGEDSAGTQLNNANMSAFADGMSPRMQMYLWSGVSLATLTVNPGNQTFAIGTASFGPQTFNVTAPLILGDDGIAAPPDATYNYPGTVNDACEPLANNVMGKIVLVERGHCQFEEKAQNAASHGAVGLIIANRVAGGPMQMGPGNPPLGTMLPVLSVSQADGGNLKMQLMNGALTATMTNAVSPRADGTIDNGVVAHEWGHYIHLRQVNCGNQQCGAESEGWGDYNALQMIVRPGDNLDGTFAMAIYATQGFDPTNAGYYGIRRFPYSTDMSKNPLTFKHIGDSQMLPMNAPQNPSVGGGANSEVHNAGEIWAEMLWEAHAAILKNSQGANPPYTFAQARRRLSDYIEGGLKMAPNSATYTQQRDAILSTAVAADPNDFVTMATAFAKRGAGSCAQSPPTNSTTLDGVVEDFNVSPVVSIVSTTVDDSILSCDMDGVLDSEEKGKVTVTVRNTGPGALTNGTMTVSTAMAGVTFPNGTTANFPTIAPFTTGSAFVEIDLDPSVMGIQMVPLMITVNAPTACVMATTNTPTAQVNYDIKPMSTATDDVESGATVWAATSAQGPSDIWAIQQPMAPNHMWTGVDYGSPSDASLESPPLNVAAAGNFVLTFKHRYQFQQSGGVNWDGGVIEVSVDNGMNWSDISMYGAAPYGGMIGDPMNQAMNVLKGRQGFVGQSAGWPTMNTATVNMGAALAGKTVKIRFRVGSDNITGAHGWDVDDIGFQGITNTPFPTVVPGGPCMPPPIADAGLDQTVFSGDLVTLDGSKSSDPKMLPLTYTWSEQSGPMVTLTAADMVKSTFTAPPVMMDTPMTFQLTVSNGKGSASAVTHVFVKPLPGTSSSGSVSGSGAGGSGSGSGRGGEGGGFQIGDQGGCGCSTVGSPPAVTFSPLLAFALLSLRRRRAGERARR